jgi:hypothetical protein
MSYRSPNMCSESTFKGWTVPPGLGRGEVVGEAPREEFGLVNKAGNRGMFDSEDKRRSFYLVMMIYLF